MKKYAFIIDVAKCENCNNCFLACKDEHCGNNWPGYSAAQPLHGHRWMNIMQKERGDFPLIDVAYLPQPCQHCDDAPCIGAGKGAVTKRDDGIVLIDPQLAKGRKDLVASCPYGAIWWNDEEQLPQKCTLCAHLLDEGWKVPRCVQSCPTGALAIFYGDEAQLQERVGRETLQTLRQGAVAQTRPRCYFRNLYRYTHDFLAGSVAEVRDGVEECAVGLTVVLKKKDTVVATGETDDFGDFRFDGLVADGSDYSVEILAGSQVVETKTVSFTRSSSVGTLRLVMEKEWQSASQV